MLCDRCKQNNATVHITRIINGVMREEHLCAQCANAEGKVFHGTPSIGWQHLFGGFAQPSQDKYCPQCGMSYRDFRQKGKMGCPQCYREFAAQVPALLQGIHGSNSHVGKIPARGQKALLNDRKIVGMKEQLSVLVADEKFEEAAKLRDEIKAFEAAKAGETDA